MQISTEFVTSAAGAAGFPRDGTPEVALVGRSNVGKSSLINALVRKTLARTSAAPGKTRLINFYRVRSGSGPARYFVDLPGYGYARGGSSARRTFDALTQEYFGGSGREAAPRQYLAGTLLLIDSRHPDLAPDAAAHAWLKAAGLTTVIVATKFDKLTRAAQLHAQRQLEQTYEGPILPVSAVTGEGLKELWTLIDRLTHPRNP